MYGIITVLPRQTGLKCWFASKTMCILFNVLSQKMQKMNVGNKDTTGTKRNEQNNLEEQKERKTCPVEDHQVIRTGTKNGQTNLKEEKIPAQSRTQKSSSN